MLSGGVDFIDPLDGTGFVSLGRREMVAPTAAAAGAPMPVAGTLSNLNVRLDQATDVTVTVYVNGSASVLGCAVVGPATACVDTADSVALVASDSIAVEITNTDGVAITNFTWTAWLAP